MPSEERMDNAKAWDYAIGMVKVDGLEPTPELLALIESEKRGEISTEQMRKALNAKYRMKEQDADGCAGA